MSENMFINIDEAHKRMLSIIQAKCKKINMAICMDKNEDLATKELTVVYHAQITWTDREGKHGYRSVSGESYPDLFDKIANELTAHKPL
jgi:hypothetical protein